MFNDYWDNQVTSLFENQIFGNAIGARILKDDANFRISSATTTESVVQFSAQLDTLMSDLNSVWEGATMADFNTQFDGVTFKGYNVIPLRRDS
jgi:putative N-acetylmannosamine-6-phosphate epimerase